MKKTIKKYRNIYMALSVVAGLLSAPSFVQATQLQNLLPYPYLSDNAHALMTSEDVMNDAASGVRIEATHSTTSVTGLFIQELSTDIDDCSLSTVYSSPGDGVGMVWSTVSLPANTPVSIGSNFLYNMLDRFMTVAGIADSEHATSLDGAWCVFLGATDLSADHMGPGHTVAQLPGNLGQYSLVPNDPQTSTAVIICADSTATCETLSGTTTITFNGTTPA